MVWRGPMESLRINKRFLTLLLIGFLIIVIFLYFFIDISATVEAISSANPSLLFLALFSILSAVFFYSLTWEVILRAISEPLGIWKAFQYVCTSIFVAIVFPVGLLSGETSRTYLTLRNSRNDVGSVIASIICHRTIDMIPFLGGACIGLIFMYLSWQFFGYAIYVVSSVVILIILAISLVLYLAIRPEKTEGILNVLFRLAARIYKKPKKLSSWRVAASEQLKLFHEGFNRLSRRPSTLTLALIISALSYSLDIIATRLVFRALGINVSFSVIITVYTVVIAIQTISVGPPGMTGPVEVSMITLYSLAGIPPVIGAAATLITRSMNLWFEMALGGVMAYWVGIKVLKGTT